MGRSDLPVVNEKFHNEENKYKADSDYNSVVSIVNDEDDANCEYIASATKDLAKPFLGNEDVCSEEMETYRLLLDKLNSSQALDIFKKLRNECIGLMDPPIILEQQFLQKNGERISTRDIEMLIRCNIIRKLYIPIQKITEQEVGICSGYCLKEDILSSFRRRIAEMGTNSTNYNDCNEKCFANNKNKVTFNNELLEMTDNIIFNEFNTLTIENSLFLNTLREIVTSLKRKHEFCDSHNIYFNEEYLISIYIRLGFLRREGFSNNNGNFVFTTPNMGIFVDYLESGNNVILNTIKRNKNHEITEEKLQSIKLGRSKLSLDFHLRYLHGIGYINRK